MDGVGDVDNFFSFIISQEDTARYVGLFLAPAEGFGLWPGLVLPFRQNKTLLCCFGPFFSFLFFGFGFQ